MSKLNILWENPVLDAPKVAILFFHFLEFYASDNLQIEILKPAISLNKSTVHQEGL